MQSVLPIAPTYGSNGDRTRMSSGRLAALGLRATPLQCCVRSSTLDVFVYPRVQNPGSLDTSGSQLSYGYVPAPDSIPPPILNGSDAAASVSSMIVNCVRNQVLTVWVPSFATECTHLNVGKLRMTSSSNHFEASPLPRVASPVVWLM